MLPKHFCVYNETRACLLSSRVTLVDTNSDPLQAVKVLIEGLADDRETGLWLNPLKTIPSVPRLSPYDLVYLDREHQVVQGIALIADSDVPPFDSQVASALVLPIHTFSASRTCPGDRVVLVAPSEAGDPIASLDSARIPISLNGCTAPDLAQASIPIESQPSVACTDRDPFAIETLCQQTAPQLTQQEKASSLIGILRRMASFRVHISVSFAADAVPQPEAFMGLLQDAVEIPADQVQLPPLTTSRSVEVIDIQRASGVEPLPREPQSIESSVPFAFRRCMQRWISQLRRSWSLKWHTCASCYAGWADAFVYGTPTAKRKRSLRTVRTHPVSKMASEDASSSCALLRSGTK